MVKQSKSLKKLAAKAEQAAARYDDPEISGEMKALATAYRSQADIVKRKEKAGRKPSEPEQLEPAAKKAASAQTKKM